MNRNERIQEMLKAGERLKDFYRFAAQNPFIDLHDACQIVLERPKATICFSFEEWNAMGRRITSGRKGIAYYDTDGVKNYVFDVSDTHGDTRYQRLIIPIKHITDGFASLNGEEPSTADYNGIYNSVDKYLHASGYLTEDEDKNALICQGVSYSLYCKTGFPKSVDIHLSGLPYGLDKNAELFKEIYALTDTVQQEIEDAYDLRQNQVPVIDDIEEEVITDEPEVAVDKKIVKVQSAIRSQYKDYDIFAQYDHANKSEKIYLGKRENYDNRGNYDNTDNSLIYVSENPSMFHLLAGSSFVLSQKELLEQGLFTEADYKEYSELCKRFDSQFERVGTATFNVDAEKGTKGVPFRYPYIEGNPIYVRYMAAQGQYPQAVVIMRLGDFYEVFGENAVKVSQELDLTLTGRDVGLSERIPMCGFPYHITDKYLEKILENHSVLVVENDEEPKYILSHAEALEETSENIFEYGGYHFKPERVFSKEEKDYDLKGITDFISSDVNLGLINSNQSGRSKFPYNYKDFYKASGDSECDIFRCLENGKLYVPGENELFEWTGNEKAEAQSETAVEEPPKRPQLVEYDDDEPSPFDEDIPTSDAEDTETIGGSDNDDVGEYEEYSDDEEETEKPKEKPKGKPLSQRKRKNKPKPQLSMFDIVEPKEQTEEEKLIEWGLKRGSGFTSGKFRIYDKYLEDPTETEFADFLKKEYGIGGGGGYNGYQYSTNGKGYLLGWRDRDHPENNLDVSLTWKQVAVGIADLIDDDNYLTDEEKEKYAYIVKRRNERINAKTDEEKIKVIARQFIDDALQRTQSGKSTLHAYEYEESANFVRDHKKELEAEINAAEEVKTILPPTPGYEYLENYDIAVEFYPQYCLQLKQAEEEPIIVSVSPEEENTDLNSVLDQSELGGSKLRYRQNVEAIKLCNKLYRENRQATADERKVLAKYVGWGGIAQVFDEHNESWHREYEELKSLLSTADYDAVRGSVLNAHYTSKEVINGIYSALERFGVKGNNRILEPALGVGNFFGYMPGGISDGAKLYGVELDSITGRIAQKLYPQANVQIKGFEETTFANDSFDLVVTNVPFGGYGVADSDYNRHKFLIHDYFIAKSVDKVKPDGIVAVITSKGTMDKFNPSARKYIADRAELLGAVRLPNNAFKQTAGTEVVTDILFFRKRKEKINADTTTDEWLSTGTTEEGYEINNYFINHPEMVLGTLTKEVGLYGAEDVTVKPDGRELKDAIAEAIQHLPQNFYIKPEPKEEKGEEIEVDYNVKPLNLKAENGKVYMRVGERMVEQMLPKTPKDAYERIAGMINLRTELRRILKMQTDGCSDDELKIAQWTLNDRYDRFVKRYGYLNNQTNVRLFKEDGDSALLFACENASEDKKTYTKAEIFTKRTIRPYVAITQTDDCFEALQISKNERGKVDIAYIEDLTKKDYDTVLFELGNAVFRNPIETDQNNKYSGFETAEQYLSGNVVRKLATAKFYAETDKSYERNVKELERVQPVPLTASEISVRLGQSWIDKDYYKQFLMKILNLGYWCREGIELYHNPHDSSWRVDKTGLAKSSAGLLATEVYGTSRANAFRLFEACLNLKDVNIYDTIEDSDGKVRRVLNQAETLAAREKQNKIKDEFKEWIFENPERRNDLEETYNRIFNQIRLPTYDGSYLKFPGMNPAIELKPHQKNAIARMMPGDSTLLHHVVGSGKTYTCIAGIMKQKQLGLINKAMVTVPNHLVEQWGADWLRLYPDAKILIATKEDLEKNNRRKFVSKVALGDWDGIIIAQSSFAKIPISTERQIRKIQEEIDRIDESISSQWDESNMPRGAVKNLERIKKSKEAQLKRLMDDSSKDNVLKFEDLGVDYLVVDEAHYYKNKFLFTKMNNVAGISTTASQRASDMELKIDYINELHGGDKGVVFATGTPISNSMTEMYTMQSYLQKQSLAEAELDFFDAWAADFGETVLSLELAPSGQGYKPRTRFAKFTNLPELLTMYRSFADVQTSDMVKLDVPEAEHIVVNLKPSDKVIELAEEIADRAEAIYSGGIDPHIDNMLKVTSDGKKLALDARCMDLLSDDEPVSKLNACAERIYEIWNDTKDFKGTQIVFCDLSTPKKAFEDYEYGKDFDAYNDLKYKLVEKGIPEEEVAFIHDAGNDKQKQSLFDDVNSGKVRVLIGSTEKCGAGTNVQKRLVALHHLDTPYRPSDMEQREGRIIRQGNSNDKVQIFTYVTERTFDSYSYQILENKQRFISQINRGDLTVREAEDIDETTLSYAEIKAITAANPKIKRKMEVDGEVSRLRVLEGQYKKNLYALQDKVNKDLPERIRRQELLLENIRKDIELVKDNYNPDPEEFSISVNGKVYTDRKEGGKALTEALYHSRPDTVVAEYCGFKISMKPIEYLANERSITVAGSGQYDVTIGHSESGNLTRLYNFIKDFAARESVAESKLENFKRDYEVAKSQLNVPFEHKEKLAELIKEQAALNAELDLNRREEVIIDSDEESDDGEQYMSVPDSAETSVAEKSERVVERKAKRKSLQQADFKVYNKQREKNPNAYIFLQNGDGYEIIGKHAERLAAENGFNTLTDTINGEEVTVLRLNNNELDIEVRKLVDSGEKVAIIEPDFAKKEEILETEEERQRIEENEQLDGKSVYEVRNITVRTDDGKNPFNEWLNLPDPEVNIPWLKYHSDYMKRFEDVDQAKAYFDSIKGTASVERKEEYGQTEYVHNGFILTEITDDDYGNYILLDEYTPEYAATIDYRAEVANSVEQEFKDFKNDELKKTPIEIFYDNYVIHVKTELSNFLQDCELEPKYYRVLLEEKGHILDSLYDGFLGYDYSSVNNYEDTQDFIEQYCEDYYEDMLKEINAEEERNAVNVIEKVDEVAKHPKYTPVYLKTAAEAFKDGQDSDEAKLYRDSNSKSKECIAAITKGISENYDYSKYHFDANFAKDIIAEYGQERVNYVLATVMQNHKGDGRYTNENREWASTIYISQSDDVRHGIDTNAHSTLINSFIDEVRRLEKEKQNKTEETMEQDKYVSKTARGDTVVDIKKGADGRGYAVVQRKKDYVVAVGYDTKDGTWKQGYYDNDTYESANKLRDDLISGKVKSETWFNPKVSTQAYIKKYNKSTMFRMPNSGEYKGYSYFVFNNRIKDSSILSDLQSDSRESAYELSLSYAEEYHLKNRHGDEIVLTAEELAKAIDGTTAEDYGTKTYDVSLPQDAIRGNYDKSTLLVMPDTSKFAGRSFYIPTSLISEDTESEGKNIVLSLPEDFVVKVTSRDKEQKDELTAEQFYKECQNAEYKEKDREYIASDDENSDKKKWFAVTLPENARIAEYDNATLFKMPKGELDGAAYYIPNGLVKDSDDGITLNLPEDFIVAVKDNKSGNYREFSAVDFISQVEGMTEDDYSIYQRKDRFSEREKVLRDNVPDEMINRPNWVIVRTKENENGKLDKFLISPVTGKYAESDNPETWTDFDTACKYAKENGGVTLAYAVDGKDNICCIDLDHCIDEKGNYSYLAMEVMNKAEKTYTEKSLSGKGIHLFGTTDGMDLRAFSKDGDLEFYQKTHFIAMTGDGAKYSNLESFDKPEMKELLERKCAKRTEWTGVCLGAEGLSEMSDREVVERASSGKYGDTFKRLYNGEDLQHNHSNSDMSLMNRLAYYCNGDKEQMLRIFASSGLYRPDKSPEYYEHTAMKAVRDNPGRISSQAKPAKPNKPVKASNNGKGGM